MVSSLLAAWFVIVAGSGAKIAVEMTASLLRTFSAIVAFFSAIVASFSVLPVIAEAPSSLTPILVTVLACGVGIAGKDVISLSLGGLLITAAIPTSLEASIGSSTVLAVDLAKFFSLQAAALSFNSSNTLVALFARSSAALIAFAVGGR